MTQIAHIISHAILWIIGYVFFPLFIASIYGLITDFENRKTLTVLYVVSFVIYSFLTALFLINL